MTPQLTNPLGAKLFYNKVPILKMRLTPYKSYKTEQPVCAGWTKMSSHRASVCLCSIYSKEIDSFPHGKFGKEVILPTSPPYWVLYPHPSGNLLQPVHAPFPTSGTKYSLHINNHKEFILTESLPDSILLGICLFKTIYLE